MSIKRFNGAGISGTKSIKLWDQTTTQNDYQSIATVVVPSGGQSSITFSNIPQNFTHLQLRMVGQFNSTGDVDIQLNGDSTSGNYSYHLMYGSGSGNGATALTTSTSYGMYAGYGNVGGNAFFAGVVDLLDYTNTAKSKVSRSFFGVDNSGSGFAMLNSGLWYKAGSGVNSDAITSIKIYSKDAVNFQQYSQVALYGIKVAS